MKKTFIFKIVLACLTLCISLNARTQTRASLPSSFTETPAPTGEVRFPAEFEPVQAVIIAHMEGDNLPVRFIKEMAEDCKVITIVDQNTYTDDSSVRTIYTDSGVDLNNCEFVMAPLDGRWTRDYSPWIVFNGTTPAIVDNIYNRVYTGTNDKSQINDDNISNVLYNKWKTEYPNLELYGMDVVHTGGNMMQDGYGNGVSDDIVYSESYEYLGLSEDEVDQRMKDYLGIDPYHVTIDPQGDYVAHVDCWGKFLAPDKILLAKVHQNHPRAKEYQQVANYFENTNCCWGYPYKVHYVELPDGVETNTTVMAPYTNSLILNKKVFVPLDSEVGGTYNADAIALYENLMPGYEIIPFECNSNQFDPNTDLNNWYGWRNTDALHCRTHEVMDFNMLFVDHRDVLWGKQENQASYPISAKFIAYSGNAITETKLHYSTDNGSTYTTVDMQQVGTTNEYTADIPGNHQEGTVIKYYITGKDASGRECVQPTFGKDEPHEFEVGTPEAIQPSTEAITLTADKTTITANGTDAITFTAMQGTTDITLLAEYYIDEEKIRSPYKTTTAETYDVYAKYNGIESDRITITVEEVAATTGEVITIDGTVGGYAQGKEANTHPLNSGKTYSLSQQYYTKAEIGKEEGGTITHIAFQTSGNGDYPYTRNIKIYIKNTTDSGFSSTSSILVTSEEEVFSGNVVFDQGNETWITIKLDKTFTYEGNNLLVCVSDNTSSTQNNLYFKAFNYTDKSRTLAKYSSSQYDPTNTQYSLTQYQTVPYLQLTFSDGTTPDPTPTPEPLVLKADKTTITANGTDAVTFSVTQGSNAVNDAIIYVNDAAQTGYTFSTTTAGTYTVYAQKGDLTSDEITITAEAPAVIKPVIDLTKYYRIKVNSGTYANQYLHISNTANTVITNAKANDLAQIFKIEDAGNGNYYLKSANNLYIKCDAAAGAWWSIYGNATNKTPLLFEYDNETEFYIRDYDKITGTSATNNSNSANSYFKVENGTVYCDAPKTLAEVVTWVLEEVPLSVTISADNNTVTVNESVQLNATAIGGTGDYTYSWSPATDLDDATIANPTFTPATADTCTFTCTVTDNGETASNTITITVKEAQQGGGDTGSDVVTIDGSVGNYSQSEKNLIPIYSYNNYSISQQYYTKEEINKDGGTITAIAFQTSGAGSYPYVRNLEIYIINSGDVFKFTNTNTIALSLNDRVFSGEVTFNEGNGTWITIDLDKDFTYNGKNVLVCVNDITGSKKNNLFFKTFTYSDNTRALCLYNNSSAYSPTSQISNGRAQTNVPCIQFTFAGDTPQQPVNPTISVDKTRIEADGTDYATFTVTPADAEIYWYKGTETAKKLDGNKFNTSIHGTYSFYAKKDELVSDTITVEAVANDLTITPSVNTILANGIEEVTFTVTQVDVNGTTQVVTNKCTFKINGTAITGNTFFTNRAGKYTVTATKNSKETSAQITATASIGEENVVLIDGNVMQPAENTTTYTVPVNNYDNYGVSQQYYTKNEIGKDEGIITYIAFKTAKDAGTYIRDIEIYMANTDESDFGSSNVMKQMTNLVYSGKVQFSSNYWIKIPLDTEFTYTGNNILVCINDKTGSQIDPLTSHFDTYAKGYNDNFRTLYKSGATALVPTSEIVEANRIGFTPFVKFTFEQEKPITLVGTKQIIKADNSDIIRFTVTQGVNNVTDKTEIYVEQYEGTTTISTTVLNSTTGHTFSTSKAGTYRAYARKGDLTSNTIEFTSVHPIILTADKTSIIADGNDAVTFTLMQNGIDVTTANGTVIYVGDEVITNTFTTTIMGTYIAYATKDGIRSSGIEITVNDKNYDGNEGVDGGENEYYNGDGSITYNKGENNEYTLIAKKINNNSAYIIQDNVKTNATKDFWWRYDQNKPHAETILTIPEKILFGDEWITITKIEDFAFSDKCDISEDGRDCYEPGNPLNSNFTGIIIPSTIEEIGTYTFGFEVEEYIICFAKTPPALSKSIANNPFYKNTYNNTILYVPAESIEAYRNALGWGIPAYGGNDYYFKNIYPITMPTYVEIEKDDLSWNNADNWRTYVKNNDETYTEQYGVMPNAGEDVLIDGNVTIPEDSVANAGNINIISGSITIADGGQLIHTNAGLTVTMEKEIVGYGSSTSPTSWYTISSPIFNFVKASDVNNLLSNDYDLYRYDEPTHYWDNIEDLDDLEGPVGNWSTLDAGRGYLYANSGDVTLQFNGVANHTSASYTLTRGTEDGKLEGFHLVGNPFTHNIYMNAFSSTATLADGYYVLSSEGAWGAELGSDKAIKPCQGVLINAAEEGTLTINKNVGNVVTRSRANNKFVTISIANNKYEDVAYVSFDAKNPLEKVSHHNNNIPMVYIPTEEAIYAIATMEDDVKEIPVAFEAKTMGQYTISVKAKNCEFESMNLVDRKTGEETNLLLEDYTFLATTTDNSERFIIRLNDNISDNEDFIFINNGEIIINKIEGKGVLQIFDVMGRYISHSEVSGSANISTEAFTNGVYIIRMTDDNGVKTQKVVL